MLMLRREKNRPVFTHLLLTVLLIGFFSVFVIWPILQVVKTGFMTQLKAGYGGQQHFTLQYVALIFKDPELVRGLWHAVAIAVSVTVVTALIAVPLAVLTVRYEFPGRKLLGGLLLVPLVLPPFVGAIGLRLVLGRYGPLTQSIGGGQGLGIDWLGSHKLAGIVIVEALHLYPIILLNVQAALANTDPAMQQAAANLGAGRWTVFRKITLPLMRPGLFAGCTLTLIWSFTELGTPLAFDYYSVTPVQVFKQITDVSDNPLPYALVVVMLVVSALLYVIGKVIFGRSQEAATTKAAVADSARRLHGGRAFAAMLAVAAVFVIAVLPHISVVLTSLSATGAWYRSILPKAFTLAHFKQGLGDDLAMSSVLNSIRYAGVATCISVVIGLAAATIIVRSNVPGRGLIDTLSMVPLAVPGLVLAFGYLAISVRLKQTYGENRFIQFLDVQERPTVLLVIAYAARRLPYVVRAAVAGLQQTPRDLELAASNLGATRGTVLRRITVPLIIANLVAGALLSFAFAMLEVSDSLVLAQKADYYPITRAILDLAQRLGDGIYIASALGVWAMTLLILTILAANSLLGKKMGAAFRV